MILRVGGLKALRSTRVVQAAAIPYRWNGGRLEIAMVTKRQRGSWIVPKGTVETGETPRQSARREASEEAGLVGRMGQRPCGSYLYLKGREPRLVVVFLMRVTRQLRRWSEDEEREREWFELERAIQRVRERGLRRILRVLARRQPA
jgi:8-oxo-dGTP pyrophosphatase MutT (NUDIX family)